MISALPPMKTLQKLILVVAAIVTMPILDASTTTRESIQYGKASWYSIKCNGGTHTASGKRLNDWAMTAAHKTLPMGTKVRVTNKENGRSVIVTITDRGPYIKGRIIDVTKGVAHKLDFITDGIVPVKVEVL